MVLGTNPRLVIVIIYHMKLEEVFFEAQIMRNNGEYVEAVKIYERVREQALDRGDKKLAIECAHMIGVTYYQEDRYGQALESLGVAEKELEDLDERIMMGAVLRDIGQVYLKKSEVKKAKYYLEKSLEVLRNIEPRSHWGISRVKLAFVFVAYGSLKGAEELILDTIRNVDWGEDKFFESTAYFNLAQVQLKLEKKPQAKKSLEKSLEILDTIASKDEFLDRRAEINRLLLDS